MVVLAIANDNSEPVADMARSVQPYFEWIVWTDFSAEAKAIAREALTRQQLKMQIAVAATIWPCFSDAPRRLVKPAYCCHDRRC